jgi:hypothetical protein
MTKEICEIIVSISPQIIIIFACVGFFLGCRKERGR